MRCAICKKELYINLKFKDLFNFEYYCNDCRTKLDIKYCVIPSENGYLFEYYYFTASDEYVDYIDNKIFDSLYRILNGTVIFIDKANVKDVLNIYLDENIKIFSTRYINLEDYFE